ncbi:hypothetical protein HJFPF1_02254 [Paramyrothecium foliicola]|nr:hypothetical protein HJFPF1_02254 [Paramyrothecium foliicola]
MTICCDGYIIDKRKHLGSHAYVYNDGPNGGVGLDNFVCCRDNRGAARGDWYVKPGDSGPFIGTTCVSRSPTPLASLAATSTENAEPYLATLMPGSSGLYDDATSMFWTLAPFCAWLYTGAASLQMAEITVPVSTATTIATYIGTTSEDDEDTTTSSLESASKRPAVTMTGTEEGRATTSETQSTEATQPGDWNATNAPNSGSTKVAASLRSLLGLAVGCSVALVLASW